MHLIKTLKVFTIVFFLNRKLIIIENNEHVLKLHFL